MDKIEQIRKEFNNKLDELKKELTPKFEVGKWYKLDGYTVVCYTTRLTDDNRASGYGISHNSVWTDTVFLDYIKYWELATPEDVKQALVNEAKKRYKVLDKLDRSMFKNAQVSSICDVECKIIEDNFYYVEKDNTLMMGTFGVFHNGKWADVIRKEKISIKFQYEVNEGTKYKCLDINKSQLDRINQILNE